MSTHNSKPSANFQRRVFYSIFERFLPTLLVAILIPTITLSTPEVKAKESKILPVTGSHAISKNMPDIEQQIFSALKKSDVQFDYQLRPNKKSLDLVKRGIVGLDIARNPMAYADSKNLIQLEPALFSIKLAKITSRQSMQKCDVPPSKQKQMTVAGILGAEIFQLFYKDFAGLTELDTIADALRFVALDRADFTFLPETSIETLPSNLKDKLFVCQNFTRELKFYSFLHKDYLWAKDPLEKAYRQVFVL